MIVKIYRGLLSGLHAIAAIALIVTTALTSFNAISRYIAGYVVFGSEELCSYLTLTMVFLVFPLIEAKGMNLSVDIIDSAVKSQRIKATVLVIRGVVISALLGVMAYYQYRVASVQYRFSAATPALKMPSYLFYAVLAICFLLGIISWVCIIFFNKRREL